MLSALFTSVADALISYAIDKLDPAEQIKSWLRLDPARLAFKKALARAYSAFARQYPEYTSSLFDQSFLSTDALPELSKLLTRNQHPDPALLAQAWGRSLGANTDFAQAATKPAAYFLERFEAELKAEPALQSIFDSRAVESLPKLEAEIQKFSVDLQRGLEEALKAAQNYQQATIHIGGDVKGEGIVIGNNNQLTINKFDYSTNYYYSGDFIALNEYYIPPDGVFQRVRVDDFIGRDWLTAKVDTFLNDPNRKSGAFLLIGDAGVGKTSFMAHLVKERRYLHLFAEQAPGQAMLQRAMQSLGSQLVTRYQIDPYKDRDTLNALSVFPDFLERILRLAASTLTEGEKIVIVCDALDEAGTFPDHFVFGLPKELPDGVYLILSQRPVNVKLPNFEPVIENLEAQGEGNLQDIEAYLSAVAKRPEVAGQIRSKEYSEDFFVQTLKEKSQGVWMYLHYIIKEIESGTRAPLDLANLPTGLVGYYAEYWDAWRTGKRGKGEEAWDELYAPLLTTLAAAQEAIPVDWIIQWADVTAKPREVTRLLTEHWRAFITEKDVNGQKAYTPYHLSFKDFITGRVDTEKLPPAQANLVKDLANQTVDAHKCIVSTFEKECNGEWEKLVEQDYPRLHLTAHLHGAGEYEKLRILLTEGDEKIKWAEAREQKEETYAGYLNDLTYVWDHAEREQNYALAFRCMLIQNFIHSLSGNILPELLIELYKFNLIKTSQCVSLIKQYPVVHQKVKAISLLVDYFPQKSIKELFMLCIGISNEYQRAKGLILLLPRLSNGQVRQVFSHAQKIKDETIKIELYLNLAAYTRGYEKKQVIKYIIHFSTSQSRNKLTDIRNIGMVIPFLPKKLKSKYIKEALSTIHEEVHDTNRIEKIINILPYLDTKSKNTELHNTLTLAKGMRSGSQRAYALSLIISFLKGRVKSSAIEDCINSAGEIGSITLNRDSVFKNLAPHLNKKQLFECLLAIERNSKFRGIYFLDLFKNVSINLSNEEAQHALQKLIEFTNYDDYYIEGLSILYPYINKNARRKLFLEALLIAEKLDSDITPQNIKSLTALASISRGKNKRRILQKALGLTRVTNASKKVYIPVLPILSYLDETNTGNIIKNTLDPKNINYISQAIYNLLDTPSIESVKIEILLYYFDNTSNWHLRSKLYPIIFSRLNKKARVHFNEKLLSSFYSSEISESQIDFLKNFASSLSFEERKKLFHYLIDASEKNFQDKLIFTYSEVFFLLRIKTTKEEQQALLKLADNISSARYKYGALMNIMPSLKPVDQKKLARKIIKNNKDSFFSDGIGLNNNYPKESLIILWHISMEENREDLFTSLFPSLINQLGEKDKIDSYVYTKNIRDSTKRIFVLSFLIEAASGDLKIKALIEIIKEITKAINNQEFTRLEYKYQLHITTPHFSSSGYFLDEEARVSYEAALHKYILILVKLQTKVDFQLPTTNPQSILDSVREIKSYTKESQLLIISTLLPYLDVALRRHAISIILNFVVSKIFDEPYFTITSSEMIKYVPEDMQTTYFQFVANSSEGNYIKYFFSSVESLKRKEILNYIIPVSKTMSSKSFLDGFYFLSAVTPFVIKYSESNVADELYRAITDVTRWWP